jgi:hypothetical protein
MPVGCANPACFGGGDGYGGYCRFTGGQRNGCWWWDVRCRRLTATPTNANWVFVGWYNNADPTVPISNNNPYTFTASADITLQARFAQLYTVTVQTDNASWGSVTTSAATSVEGETVTIQATPQSGYSFVRWEVVTGTISAVHNNTNANRTFNMPAQNVTIRAIFEVAQVSNQSTVTMQTNDTWGGWAQARRETGGTWTSTLTGATHGSVVSIRAEAEAGYYFERWEIISGNVSLDTSRFNNTNSFVMPNTNVTIRAYFVSDGWSTSRSTVTMSSNNSNWGTAAAMWQSGDWRSQISAAHGHDVSIRATPRSGYRFVRWEVVSGGIELFVNNYGEFDEYDFFVMPSRTVSIRAVFEPNSTSQNTVTVQTNDASWGTASASRHTGTWATQIDASNNSTVLLRATPRDGYRFVRWDVISGNANIEYSSVTSRYSFIMPNRNVTVRAIFEPTQVIGQFNANIYTRVTPTLGGTITGGGIFNQGGAFTQTDIVTLQANPNVGWVFEGWYNNNILISTNRLLSFHATHTNIVIEARFINASQANLVNPNPIIPHNPDTPLVLVPNPINPIQFPTVSDSSIGASAWAIPEIDEAIRLGIIPPELLTNYQSNMTRAEFCRTVIRMMMAKSNTLYDEEKFIRHFGININHEPFTDTSDRYVKIAYALRITQGTGSRQFSPNSLITRQEAAAMLNRAAAVFEFTHFISHPLRFKDETSIAIWALSHVDFVSANGIMQGTGNDNFAPNGFYTREQAFTTILRLYKAFPVSVYTMMQ